MSKFGQIEVGKGWFAWFLLDGLQQSVTQVIHLDSRITGGLLAPSWWSAGSFTGSAGLQG